MKNEHHTWNDPLGVYMWPVCVWFCWVGIRTHLQEEGEEVFPKASSSDAKYFLIASFLVVGYYYDANVLTDSQTFLLCIKIRPER